MNRGKISSTAMLFEVGTWSWLLQISFIFYIKINLQNFRVKHITKFVILNKVLLLSNCLFKKKKSNFKLEKK